MTLGQRPETHSARRINNLARHVKANSYLEIGVQHGYTFLAVDIESKVAVDPQFLFDFSIYQSDLVEFNQITSDEFFLHHARERTFDVMFIDGLHTFEQAFRDFCNSICHSHSNSIWIIDDTIPSDVFSTLRDPIEAIAFRQAAGVHSEAWHGDVFKLVFAIHDFFPEFSYVTVNTDGNPQTVIWRRPRKTFSALIDNLETISRLTYFDVHRHLGIFNVMAEEQAIDCVVSQVLSTKGNLCDKECVKWAIRLFLGRDPACPEEIEFHNVYDSFNSIRTAFCQTQEFKNFFKQVNNEFSRYAAPLFLLPDHLDKAIECRARRKFSSPSLQELSSQLCTYSQFQEKAYSDWCKEIEEAPGLHRKQWEFVWLLAAMKAANLLRTGARALGFGTGQEPIPAVLAKYGVQVVASDAPLELDIGQGWSSTNQLSRSVDDLFRPKIVSREDFYENVSWRPIDMNAIPADLVDFDVCWSACALEHLGSIDHGLQFVRNSLGTLRSGGFAIHTTEFNLSSNADTFESAWLSIFRKSDIERLADELVREGHDVWPLNFHPGNHPIDEVIDIPPYRSEAHLKLEIEKYTVTSIGFVVRKK